MCYLVEKCQKSPCMSWDTKEEMRIKYNECITKKK